MLVPSHQPRSPINRAGRRSHPEGNSCTPATKSLRRALARRIDDVGLGREYLLRAGSHGPETDPLIFAKNTGIFARRDGDAEIPVLYISLALFFTMLTRQKCAVLLRHRPGR